MRPWPDLVQILLTFWRRSFTFNSNKSPTWCNNFSVYYPCICLQNFRLFIPCIFCTYCNKVTNGCNSLFCVFISIILPYMFRGLISPSSGVSQAVFYVQPFGSRSVYVAPLRVPVDWFVVVVSLYWCHGGSPVYRRTTTAPVQWNHHDKPVHRHTQSH